MKQILSIILLSLLSCATSYAQREVFTQLEQAYRSGAITADEMILNKFYYMFDQSKLNRHLVPDVSMPLKCGSETISEYQQLENILQSSTRIAIESYLTLEGLLTDYISPSGHFKISYSTTGGNAVPSADENENGVPDYVEWIATYLDHSWNVLITQCGFRGPDHTGGDGYYNVSFQSMSAYGYTTTSGVDGNERTRIVLHNTFQGFPPNHDPEGGQRGAAKVTCAHEFKHASQYVYTAWREGGWLELDASWAEEIAYDYVNDTMLNFTGSGDPFSNPDNPLDSGPSYEDYFWQDYLHQRFDNNSYTSAPVIVAFWERRRSYASETVLTTYDQVLRTSQFNSSLAQAFTEYCVWNFYTGSRAVSGFGYDEAGISGFPMAVLKATHESYPASGSGSDLNHLACLHIRLNPGGQSGLRVSFDGPNSIGMSVVVSWTTGSTVTVQTIPLDANNEGTLETQTGVFGVLLPIITQTTGLNFAYNYNILPAPTFQFVNRIEETTNYGTLVIDNDTQNPVPSGAQRSFTYGTNHVVRTNEVPFVPNWSETGYTEKHHRFYRTANPDFSLNHQFSALPSTPFLQDANFERTSPATITTDLIDAPGTSCDSVQLRDPWRYYQDQNGNWLQSNQYITYGAPFVINNNTLDSYGGVFLNQGEPNFTRPPYYSVGAPRVNTFTIGA